MAKKSPNTTLRVEGCAARRALIIDFAGLSCDVDEYGGGVKKICPNGARHSFIAGCNGLFWSASQAPFNRCSVADRHRSPGSHCYAGPYREAYAYAPRVIFAYRGDGANTYRDPCPNGHTGACAHPNSDVLGTSHHTNGDPFPNANPNPYPYRIGTYEYVNSYASTNSNPCTKSNAYA